MTKCCTKWFTPRRLILLAISFTAIYMILVRSISSNENMYEEVVASNSRNGVEKLKSGDPGPPSSEVKEKENAEATLKLIESADSPPRTPPQLVTVAKVETAVKWKFGDPKKLCPTIEENSDLIGPLKQATLLIENLRETDIAAVNSDLKPGGQWSPTDCKARYKIAVIFPFRDRQSHLTRLVDYLIPLLKRQRLDFRFIVTEQYGSDLFNKGRIMNAAFKFAEKLQVDCVIFHDVDMFPQDDRASYSCPDEPLHLGAFVNTLGYQLWYKEIVGGALAVTMHDYRAVNGYSNLYWGWGGEDDDMGSRILSQNYTIERPDSDTSRYTMLKHVKRKRTAPKLIYDLLKTSGQRVAYDGLNETDRWTVRKVAVRPLYYHLYVDVGPVPNEWREKPKA